MHLETCVNLLVAPVFPESIFPQLVLVYFTLANLSDMQPFGVRQLVCWMIWTRNSITLLCDFGSGARYGVVVAAGGGWWLS